MNFPKVKEKEKAKVLFMYHFPYFVPIISKALFVNLQSPIFFKEKGYELEHV